MVTVARPPRIYRRQASLSNLENGLMEVDASTLVYLAGALGKPISHFFPKGIRDGLEPEPSTPEMKELVIQARRLHPRQLKGITAQVRALADLDETSQTGRTPKPG